jgi:hypothetical protein
MKKALFLAMCAVMVFGLMSIAYAQRDDWDGGIRSRIRDAKQSIDRGIEHGSITRPEARKLHEEFDGILNRIDRMKRDGRLDRVEREKINNDLDRLERHIRREKRDDDKRGDDWDGGIRSRIRDGKQSIERGIEHGSITRPEARKLHDELDGILNRIDRMKRDGRLDRVEREKINSDLDRLERHIRREKRDSDKR